MYYKKRGCYKAVFIWTEPNK